MNAGQFAVEKDALTDPALLVEVTWKVRAGFSQFWEKRADASLNAQNLAAAVLAQSTPIEDGVAWFTLGEADLVLFAAGAVVKERVIPATESLSAVVWPKAGFLLLAQFIAEPCYPVTDDPGCTLVAVCAGFS